MKLIPNMLAIAVILSPAVCVADVTSIVDVQFNPAGTGVSPLFGQVVTVSGIVTSSGQPNNLDLLHIQQPGEEQWAGIELRGNALLLDLVVGDAVTVTGWVDEISGKTILNFVTEVVVTGKGSIAPLDLDPNLFSNYSLANTEPYESMLVRLVMPPGPITVVEQNADGNSNFGEWRVGSNPASPMEGCRILTGRQSRDAVSSLNVSWVNDDVWATNSGNMNVPVIVVAEGDTFDSITGIMSYSFGNMKLLPRNNNDINLPTIFSDSFESKTP